MSRPVVSILIDTYNHEQFIEQAIVSVLEQEISPPEMEVLVVDDGSTDSTAAIVRKFLPRVRYLRKENGGQASAFNFGIPETQGEIVAFLDGDDWWAKDKLRLVLDAFANNPEVGAVGHGYYEVDSASRPINIVVPDRDYRLDYHELAMARLISQMGCFLGTSRFTARRDVLRKILPVPEDLVVEADEYMFTLAPAIAPVVILSRPLFHYRLHDSNLFMINDDDPVKLLRKRKVLEALLRTLPEGLEEFGVPDDILKVIMEHLQVDVKRMKLSMDGGKPWQTFEVERAAFALAYTNVGFGYKLFKSLVLGLALVTPPRRFYGFRKWYAARGLSKVREAIGEATSASPIVQTNMKSGESA